VQSAALTPSTNELTSNCEQMFPGENIYRRSCDVVTE
jgi:hypothetical protein